MKKEICKKGHVYDKCIPFGWESFIKKNKSADHYYKRKYTEEEKKIGKLIFVRCRNCNKLKWGLVKEGEELKK